MNSNWVGSGIARARSVTNMTAPLSTVINNRSRSSARARSRKSAPICAPSSAMRAWICSSLSRTDLMSPGYSSGDSAATPTACHVIGLRTNGGLRSTARLLMQSQPSVASAGDQSLITQCGADGHPALAAPSGDQRVDSADLLVGHTDRTTGDQPTADDPTT